MSLHPDFIEAVRRLHPGVNFLRDVIVQDDADGRGSFLAQWNLSGNPPADDAITAAMAAPVVPQTISMLSARRALRAAGLLDKINAAVVAAAPEVQDAWQFSNALDRRSPTVQALAAAIGLSGAQMDDLFIQAASLAPL